MPYRVGILGERIVGIFLQRVEQLANVQLAIGILVVSGSPIDTGCQQQSVKTKSSISPVQKTPTDSRSHGGAATGRFGCENGQGVFVAPAVKYAVVLQTTGGKHVFTGSPGHGHDHQCLVRYELWLVAGFDGEPPLEKHSAVLTQKLNCAIGRIGYS